MRIFSGIRPSGQLHLGNYFGALKNWIGLQDKYECIFAVVDYHGITTPFDPKKIKENIKETVLDFLAAGVNPQKSALVIQSHLPEHLELAWIFGTITPISWIERIPTYKEKTALHPKYINLGLLSYPVLMAADILIYKAERVPVGEDQLPHIELANQIGQRFNHMFGETFPKVEAIIGQGSRIMSLADPFKKMSKSGDEGIGLIDSAELIRQKTKRAVTDSGKEIKYDPETKPALSNLLTIYSLLAEKPIKEVEKKYQGKGYATFKNDLAEVVIKGLKPFREKRADFAKNPDYIKKILANGESKARKISQQTLGEVKEKMGLV